MKEITLIDGPWDGKKVSTSCCGVDGRLELGGIGTPNLGEEYLEQLEMATYQQDGGSNARFVSSKIRYFRKRK